MRSDESDNLELLTPIHEPYTRTTIQGTCQRLRLKLFLPLVAKTKVERSSLLESAMQTLIQSGRHTRVYNVEFPDGRVDKYAADIIAESMFTQVDDEEVQYLLMDEIVDHLRDGTAVLTDDQI
jgi:hypothetical protein